MSRQPAAVSHPSQPYQQTVHALTSPWAEAKSELYIACFGVFQSLGDFNFRNAPQRHCLHFVLDGCGEMACNGTPSVVSGGELYIFWPGNHIQYHDYPGTPWRYQWLNLDGHRVTTILGRAGLHPGRNHYPLPATSHALRWLATTGPALARRETPPALPLTAAWELVEALRQDLRPVGRRPVPLPLAQACRTLIDAQYMNPLSVEQMARDLGADRTTLFRQFRRRYSLSPKAYLMQVRLAGALELLRTTDLPVKSVAQRSGFTDAQYFNRVFRQHYQTTPQRWREG